MGKTVHVFERNSLDPIGDAGAQVGVRNIRKPNRVVCWEPYCEVCQTLQERLAVGSRDEWIPAWVVPSQSEASAIPLSFNWIANPTEGFVQEMIGKEGESYRNSLISTS